MAELLDAAQSPGYLQHALEAGRITVICWLVLYLTDFFLTLSAERRHIWRTKWTPLKTFHFFNRYVTMAAIVSNAAFVLGKSSTELCSKICWIQPVLCTLAIVLCSTIAAIRVHVLYNRHRGVLFLLALPLLIMSGVTIGLSTQVRPFVVPAAVADKINFSGCIPTQTRKRTFLTIWILPLCFDSFILLFTLLRQCSLRRSNGASGTHALARIINKHLLYFSIIFACNILNVGFFVLADPSLKSINVPATVALTSILTGRLVISLYSTKTTSPVIQPTRRDSTSSRTSRGGGGRGDTWNSSSSRLPSRSGISTEGINSSASDTGSEGEKNSHEKVAAPTPAHFAVQIDETGDRHRNVKKPSISSRASIKTSSSTGSSSRRRRSQDHVIVPIVPDASRYSYYSHRHSNSSSSSATGGVLRPLLLANSLAPVLDSSSHPSSSSGTSTIVTAPPLPHPNPSMAPSPPRAPADRPPFASPIPTCGGGGGGGGGGPSSHSVRTHSTTFSATTGPLVHLVDNLMSSLSSSSATNSTTVVPLLRGGGGATSVTGTNATLDHPSGGKGGPSSLEIPAIEPSTPLTFSAAFFDAYASGGGRGEGFSSSSPNSSHMSRFKTSRGRRRLGQEEEDHDDERDADERDDGNEEEEGRQSSLDDDDEADDEPMAATTTGDLGELTREARDRLRREMQRLERQPARPFVVPTLSSVFSSSDEGGGGGVRRGQGDRAIEPRTTTTSEGGGGGRGSSSSSSSSSSSAESSSSRVSTTRSERSSQASLGGPGTSLRYYTSQFPNPSSS